MAKNTTLKTRIQNRHDTEANWTTASNATKPFIPLKGEVIVYDPDTTNTSPRVKIGDGVTKVGDLAFIGGDISKYVTLDTSQTITATKTFINCDINVRGGRIYAENKVLSNGEIESHTRIGDDSDNKPAKSLLIDSNGDLNTDSSMYLEYRTQFGALSVPTYYKKLRIGSEIPLATSADTSDVINTIKFPFKSGTVALLSDIPTPPTNYVTTDTAQTITGGKTFNEATHFETGISIGNSTVGDYLDLTVDNDTHAGIIHFASESVVGCTLTLPDGVNGTIATLEDIPLILTNYVTTDTDQNISGIKTFTEGLKVDSIKTTNNVVLLSTNSIATTVSNSSRRLLLCGNEVRPKYSLNSGNTATEIALLSDIPTNYVTTDTSQTISGVKTLTGNLQLQGVGIAAKVGGENSSYTNILKGGGNVVEVGSTGYQTRIYSNGRISVYDYSTSPYTSEKVAYQSEIPTNYVTTNTEQTINGSKTFSKAVSVNTDYAGFKITGGGNTWEINARTSEGPLNIVGQGSAGANTYQFPNKSGTIALTSDIPNLSIAPIKVKDTFVASSWATSSAATDTQFGKYYKDVTIPNKNIINVRCVSTKGMSGITLDYAPEIKCNNRRTSDTNLRIYSNSQLEGAVTITLVGDTLPNKFSKTNATLSASSWTTSSATVDTQFAKYYTDITVPAGDVMNIRILSNEGITGISTAAYYPEVWSDNRKINSTTLRVYSNKQVAGSVIILTMEV